MRTRDFERYPHGLKDDGTHVAAPPDEAGAVDPWCDSQAEGWLCTRIANHDGRHMAGAGMYTVASWLDSQTNQAAS